MTDAKTVAPGLSLVIPAYNEEDRLAPTLDRYLPVLESYGIPFEVLVVVDGQDKTEEVVQRYANRGVRCLRYPHKLGRGGAILEGFRRARLSLVAYADADGSVPPDDLRRLVSIGLEKRICVIASRRLDPSVVVVPETRWRRSVGWVWHALVRVSLNVRVADAQCGLKVFPHEAVDLILNRLTVTNRAFEVGMLYHVVNGGYPVVEVPVRYRHDFNTRMPIGKAVPVMFLTLMGMSLANRFRYRRALPIDAMERLNDVLGSV
jgi:glycosyltransferase involved in cell wall biosynthesis